METAGVPSIDGFEVVRYLKWPCLANFSCFTELWNFLWQAWTSSEWWLILGHVRNHIIAWNLLEWCNVPWNGSLFKMAMLSQCLRILISAGRGCCRSLNVLSNSPKLTWPQPKKPKKGWFNQHNTFFVLTAWLRAFLVTYTFKETHTESL